MQQQQQKSILYQNHGQRLDEELRHRKSEDPYYATVAGGIWRLEGQMKDLKDEQAKQRVSLVETQSYGVSAADPESAGPGDPGRRRVGSELLHEPDEVQERSGIGEQSADGRERPADRDPRLAAGEGGGDA